MGFKPYGEYLALPYSEGASQTFRPGALIALSSGYAVEASSDPSKILGVSMHAGHNSSAGTDKIMVALNSPHTFFEARVKGTSTANKTALSDIGASYGVVADGNGEWWVDKDDTSNTRVTVLGLIDPPGTDNGRVIVRFLASTLY